MLACQIFFVGFNLVNFWAEWQYSHGNFYEAAIIQPLSWRYQFRIGTILLKADRPDLAIRPLMAAWRLFPGYFDAGNNLAIALAGAGRKQEAIALLQEIIQYWPYERAMKNLARIRNSN